MHAKCRINFMSGSPEGSEFSILRSEVDSLEGIRKSATKYYIRGNQARVNSRTCLALAPCIVKRKLAAQHAHCGLHKSLLGCFHSVACSQLYNRVQVMSTSSITAFGHLTTCNSTSAASRRLLYFLFLHCIFQPSCGRLGRLLTLQNIFSDMVHKQKGTSFFEIERLSFSIRSRGIQLLCVTYCLLHLYFLLLELRSRTRCLIWRSRF